MLCVILVFIANNAQPHVKIVFKHVFCLFFSFFSCNFSLLLFVILVVFYTLRYLIWPLQNTCELNYILNRYCFRELFWPNCLGVYEQFSIRVTLNLIFVEISYVIFHWNDGLCVCVCFLRMLFRFYYIHFKKLLIF